MYSYRQRQCHFLDKITTQQHWPKVKGQQEKATGTLWYTLSSGITHQTTDTCCVYEKQKLSLLQKYLPAYVTPFLMISSSPFFF